MENPRCSYRHSGFSDQTRKNIFSAFTSDNLHDGSDQCWMEGKHVGNFGTEEEPEYFCIFHALEDKEPPPGFSKDEREASQPGVLKELLIKWNEVNEKREGKERLTFVLPGMQCSAINLGNFNFSHNLIFDDAIFSGITSFENATFSGDAMFNDATFSGAAMFRKATFSGAARFSDATFSGTTWFSDATFSGATWFKNSTFNGITLFNDATFSGYAVFSNATFSEKALFYNATFIGDAWFDSVEFNGRVYFDNSSFGKPLEFRSNSFDKGCWFTKSKFGDLKYSVHLGEKILFNACSGTFTFTDQDCAKLSFLNMDMSNADFLGADIKNTRFEACHWEIPEESSYSIVHNHKEILKAYTNPRSSDDESVKKEAEDGIIKLRSHYLQLKKNLEEGHYYRQAGEFHYREMEIREMLEKSWFDKLMLWSYRKLADFGESWIKLGGCLLASLLLCAGFVFAWQWTFGDASLTLWESLKTVGIAVVPSAFRKGADFSNLHWVSKGIIMGETVTALILAALLAMAVRRRFRR